MSCPVCDNRAMALAVHESVEHQIDSSYFAGVYTVPTLAAVYERPLEEIIADFIHKCCAAHRPFAETTLAASKRALEHLAAERRRG